MEQLSSTIQMTPAQLLLLKSNARAAEDMRLAAINMTVNIDRRLSKLFDLIENDLLGRLQCSANYISPYPVSLTQTDILVLMAVLLSFSFQGHICVGLCVFTLRWRAVCATILWLCALRLSSGPPPWVHMSGTGATGWR